MAYFAANVGKPAWLVGMGVLLIACGVFAIPVGAQTNIDVTVCDGVTPATLTASLPDSDSVVNVPMVTLQGTVSQSNQLEVYINNTFNGVEPLSARDTTYSTPVQLYRGTQTIKLVAIDTCQVQNATASMVLTYQPAVPPSTGDDVPTEIPGTTGGVVIQPISPGVPVPSAAPNQVFGGIQPMQQFFDQVMLPPLVGVGNSLDLTTQDVTPVANRLPSLLRFILLITGLLFVLLAKQLSRAILAASARVPKVPTATPAVQRGLRIGITSVGAVLIALVFLLP